MVMRTADATQMALKFVQSDARVTDRLGKPIEAGWFIGGKIETTPDRGDASLVIPVHGPRGNASVYAVAIREKGFWQITSLEFSTEADPRRIDLLR
jgi:hypothetical protein